MNPLKKLVGQTAVYGVSSILGRFLNYLLVPLYTRVFTTDQYGVVTEMYAYVAFLIVVLTYGMETAFFRFSSQSEDKEKVFGTSVISIFGTSSTFILLASLFCTPISNWLGYPNHSEYVVWFAFIVGLDALSAIPMAKLRELGKAKSFMAVSLVNIGVNIGLNLFFLVYCKSNYESGNTNWIIDTFYNPTIGVGYVFISNLVASICKILLLSPQLLSIQFKLDKQLWKKMAWYGLPLLFGGLAGIINETLDRILIKYLLPLPLDEAMSQLGIYGACYKVSIIMTLFVQAFRFAAEPFFFSQAKEENAKELYSTVMNYFIITCSFIFLSIMLFLDEVMLFVGPEFREGAKIVPILLLANLFLGIYFNLSIWYKLSNKTKYGAYLAIFGALITLVLNIWLIPEIGYMGSAWATLVCYVAMVFASYYLGRKHMPVNYKIGKAALYLGLAFTFYLVVENLPIETKAIRYTTSLLAMGAFLLPVYLIEIKKT